MRTRFACSISIMVMLASLWLMAQVKDFRPVTEAMLRNPAPGDWLNWRRTDNAWGFSPLDQINRQNVQQLQLAWSWAMDDSGAQEATPLVYDGVMYLPNPRGVIQALDAATGDLIWEYRPGVAQTPAPTPSGGGAEQTAVPRLTQRPNAGAGGDEGRGIQRNVGIYGDKIFATTNDAHIVAVDARTGKLVWDTKVADSKLGYQYTSGPIVVRGKVIAGITGCTRYKEDVCFITGHDAATGREVWRTSTIARPGEPGGDTWGDLPLTFRAGGDAWIPGSYDPDTNLVYWGTAQAKPWARVARGTDGDALYTNSTLALDPDTGKMKWYYQHLPGETQDMDEVFENILIDVGGRKSLFKMGKLGILWQLDRTSGAFIHATDIGYQNIVQVNPRMAKSPTVKARSPNSASKSTNVRAPLGSRVGARWPSARKRTCSTSRSISTARRPRLVPSRRSLAAAALVRCGAEITNIRSQKAISVNSWPSISSLGGPSGVIARLRLQTRLRSRQPVVSYSAATGIVTCTPTTRPPERSSGRHACRPPLRDFRSRIWRRENSTWPCRRGLAAGAGPRCLHLNWLQKFDGQTPATRCSCSRFPMGVSRGSSPEADEPPNLVHRSVRLCGDRLVG